MASEILVCTRCGKPFGRDSESSGQCVGGFCHACGCESSFIDQELNEPAAACVSHWITKRKQAQAAIGQPGAQIPVPHTTAVDIAIAHMLGMPTADFTKAIESSELRSDLTNVATIRSDTTTTTSGVITTTGETSTVMLYRCDRKHSAGFCIDPGCYMLPPGAAELLVATAQEFNHARKALEVTEDCDNCNDEIELYCAEHNWIHGEFRKARDALYSAAFAMGPPARPRRRKIPVTPKVRERLHVGDYTRAGGDAKCEQCGRTYNEHDVLDTPNGGWWAVACDGRILKL